MTLHKVKSCCKQWTLTVMEALMGAGYMQATAGSSAADAMEGWDSTDMDDFQEASSEVDGVPPSLHLLADPTIPVLVPATQVSNTHNSDQT